MPHSLTENGELNILTKREEELRRHAREDYEITKACSCNLHKKEKTRGEERNRLVCAISHKAHHEKKGKERLIKWQSLTNSIRITNISL